MIGEILGNRYELLEQIGEGGMSIVYKARCNKLNRFVAVKILKNEFADNEEIVKKFKIEATAIATLSHSNIVNVLDVGSQDNMNYIVMEYVSGKTLKDVIKEFGPINCETSITVSIQIAKALECAHKNGIIHRDVKPQNILVTEDGIVKVTDFGIAKSTASTTLTNTTTIMGSAHYFSPEQAKGTIVDTRTDLYSLGVVIYEMITGKLPFEADSPVTIALKHIQEDAVPPKIINSKVPQSLNDLVLKLIEKEPKDRYQNAVDVINDLQKIKNDPNTMILGMNANSSSIDDGHTIVMNAVNPDDYTNEVLNKKKNNSDEELDDYDDDEYYDDDDYDDDYDDEYEDEVDKKKTGKRNKIIIGSLIGIIAIILVFVGAFALFSNSQDKKKTEMVVIPKISGLTLEQAKAALEKEGLVMVEGEEQESDKEKGTIIKVDPSEGTKVEKGSKVRVNISKGNDSTNVIMKDFSESDLDSIKTYFNGKNIPYNVEYEYSSSIPEGYIIRTNPPQGTEIKKNETVTIYVSKGEKKEYVKVPNVTGMTYDEAKDKLADLGLLIEMKESPVDDKSKNGIVQSQTNSGMSLEKGATVTVYIGVYKEKSLDVASIGLKNGMSVTEAVDKARTAIKNCGINIYLDYDNMATGTLSGWTPHSGKLTEDGTLTLTFSSTKEPDKDLDGNPGSNGQ